MRKKSAGLLSLVLAAGLGSTLGAPAVSATPAPTTQDTVANAADRPDEAAGHELPNPLEEKRRALREEALTQVLNGDATVKNRGGSQVVKVSRTKSPEAVNARGNTTAAAQTEDQYVELGREATDRIFVVLAEFGNERHPDYPDQDTSPNFAGPTKFDGPLHNEIPEPDRSVDNTTVWQPDYSRNHFDQLYFGEGGQPGAGAEQETVREYYERQSSGRYSIEGTVTDWVKVRYNEARYGRSNFPTGTAPISNCGPGSNVCSNTWNLVEDAVNQWWADQRAAGLKPKAIKQELATFDVWDRYDIDGDGNFNESDGYIDHFQIVHSGGDQADGDPIQAEDAIWSHRWYVQTTPIGTGGPEGAPLGGAQIGKSGIWVGDYTTQPENGGMSVFAHEYGHDLGLPDLYDTGGGENSVNYWSMMAQSRVDGPNDQALGTRGADLGAWEKLQLGWLDYETVLPSQNRRLELGPHEYNSAKAQAAVVVLPKKNVTADLTAPYEGTKSWWSGTGDDYTSSMARSVALPAGAAQLAFQANYNIEAGYDYAYVEVNDGTGWVSLPGTVTGTNNNGIEGDTGGEWVPATFDLSAYSGQTVDLRIRYVTDGGVQGNTPAYPAGIFVDALSITSGGTTVFEDGAESSPNGWTLNGFRSVGATISTAYDNYYIASHRDYVSFDKYLQSGPYNFGFANTKPDWVERFPYQDGLLMSYWDTSQSDNNTSQHPGSGLILPIDANPRPLVRLDGQLWRPRVAGYDAPFSLEKSDSFELHVNGQASYIRGQAAQPLFRDDRAYWDASQPSASVQVPNNGVNVRVTSNEGTSMGVRIWQR
ncbi:MAG: immune inhibitor A domain-containing protein [Nocardioides sp.]